MECMDEFSEAVPNQRKYGRTLTAEEYEEQGSLETHKAIGDLLDYLGNNPNKYHAVLQSRRKQEYEESSGLSFIKSKMFSAIGMEALLPCHVTPEECHKELKELKANMSRAFNYAQTAKGKRYSRRLANRRNDAATASPTTTKTTAVIPPPPPPPPPPPLLTAITASTPTTVPPAPPPPLLPTVAATTTTAATSPPPPTSPSVYHTPPNASPVRSKSSGDAIHSSPGVTPKRGPARTHKARTPSKTTEGANPTTTTSSSSTSLYGSIVEEMAKRQRSMLRPANLAIDGATPNPSGGGGPLPCTVVDEIKAGVNRRQLRPTNAPKTPNGTPIKTQVCHSLSSEFSQRLQAKFKNANTSPSPSRSGKRSWEEEEEEEWL